MRWRPESPRLKIIAKRKIKILKKEKERGIRFLSLPGQKIFSHFLKSFYQRNIDNREIMSTYSSLLVYKSGYDLLIQLIISTASLKREYKFTFGEDIKKESMEMIKNIYRANSSVSKKQLIQSARENTEMIRLNLRILLDLKQINLKRFVYLNERIEMVSKQLAAWQKSSK